MKLFLLDAYALIYRAYYAMMRSPRITTNGVNTSAVFGFVNTLEDIIRKEQPTHLAVCFDPKGGHTFRHDIYPEYKANRMKQPEDITIAVPYIKRILKAMCIPVVEVEGYEADDVIGTLAKRASAEGITTYMVTMDKDYGQLVDENIKMYRPPLKGKDFEIRGVKEICERYGIDSPAHVIDLLALEGDASDNVPGCRGIGEKGAANLIRQFGSVENMLANVEQIAGANRKKVEAGAEQILFSKMLVTIRTDVPLDFGPADLARCEINYPDLREVYTELEFKSFLSKLPGEKAASTPQTPPTVISEPSQPSLFDFDNAEAEDEAPQAVTQAACRVETLTGPAVVASFVASAPETFGLACYAVGEEAMTAGLRGIALSTAPEEGVYIPFPADESARAALADALRPLFAAGHTVVSHDVKRDMILLRRIGIDFQADYYDLAVAHYLLQSEMRHNLEDIALRYLSVELAPLSATRRRYPELPSADAPVIMGLRAAVSLALRHPLSEAVSAEGMEKLFNDVEIPLVAVLADMEWTGVRVDTGELATLSSRFTEQLRDMEKHCYELAGHTFNIASPRQVGEVLFDELKLDPSAKRTKAGAYSTAEDVLEKLAPDHEIVRVILEIRGLSKLLATYINALPELINPATGKIHTTFNQTLTSTGRLSSANPNLQNIPIRTAEGREIRRAFIPDSGCIMLAADYSQIELRLMADLSGDPDMIEAFRAGGDIHRSTAAKIYHVPAEEVTANQRRNAKTANFGIIYGISAFGLSQRLGIPRSEAKELIEEYFRTYPHINEYIEGAHEEARRDGYVATIMGRKRYLPEINSRNAVVRSYAERNAVNAPIQGSAADVIKVAMVGIWRKMKAAGMKSRMILQVHDELVFNVIPTELPALQQLVVSEMQAAYRSDRVTLEVGSGVGINWLEAH